MEKREWKVLAKPAKDGKGAAKRYGVRGAGGVINAVRRGKKRRRKGVEGLGKPKTARDFSKLIGRGGGGNS